MFWWHYRRLAPRTITQPQDGCSRRRHQFDSRYASGGASSSVMALAEQSYRADRGFGPGGVVEKPVHGVHGLFDCGAYRGWQAGLICFNPLAGVEPGRYYGAARTRHSCAKAGRRCVSRGSGANMWFFLTDRISLIGETSAHDDRFIATRSVNVAQAALTAG